MSNTLQIGCNDPKNTASAKRLTLPYGVSIVFTPKVEAKLTSDLVDVLEQEEIVNFPVHCAGIGAAQGMENLLVALAHQGVLVDEETVRNALETAVGMTQKWLARGI